MKNIILAALIAAFLMGCKADKKAELDKLKKKHDEIALQIKALEKELGSDALAGAPKLIVKLSTTDIKTTEFNHYVEIQGRLEGDEIVTVIPRNMGVITKVYAKEGQKVKKGQVLAQIDDAMLQKGLKELNLGLDLAKTVFEKQSNLWNQKIGSEIQYLQAKNTKESLESKKASLEEQIEMCKIQAPFDGTVEEVTAKVGQYASPASPLPLFRIVNFNTIKAVAEVAETYASKIKEGDDITLFFPDTKHEILGKVNFTSNFINPTNRTFLVNAVFKQDASTYKANMIMVLKINDYKSAKALVVPLNLIQSEKDKNYIYVAVADGAKTTAVRKYIKTGQSYGGLVEILEGLSVGDKLIINGYQTLENNQEISL